MTAKTVKEIYITSKLNSILMVICSYLKYVYTLEWEHSISTKTNFNYPSGYSIIYRMCHKKAFIVFFVSTQESLIWNDPLYCRIGIVLKIVFLNFRLLRSPNEKASNIYFAPKRENLLFFSKSVKDVYREVLISNN